MSPIKQRILQYLDSKNVSKYKFYKETSVARGVLDKTTGISEDNISKFIKYATDIDLVWLLTGQGDMLLNIEVDEEVHVSEKYKIPKVVTVDNNERDNIVLVPQKASAGYLSSYNDPEFIKQLPSYRMPNINNGTYRMFQLDGHSMHPTMQDSSYVVCEWVENWEEDIKDDRVYVVVSIDDGVVIKRVLNRLNKYGSLYCKSDNRREYHNFAVKKESIKEVWHVKMHMTFEIPNPVTLYERMNDLEAELEHIKSLNIELRQ